MLCSLCKPVVSVLLLERGYFLIVVLEASITKALINERDCTIEPTFGAVYCLSSLPIDIDD